MPSPCSSAAASPATTTAFMVPSILGKTTLITSTSTSRGSRRPRVADTTTIKTPSDRQSTSSKNVNTWQLTLQPKDCSWKSERDLRAIESEFYVNSAPLYAESLPNQKSAAIGNGIAVDEDMRRLRRRMQVIGRKEKQWASFCQQMSSLAVLTGVPMVNPENGNPTATAWAFLSISSAVPLYILCVIAQWIHYSTINAQHFM